MPILPFKNSTPLIHPQVNFLAPDCWITGNTKVGKDCSVFFGTSIRGDLEEIVIEEGSNIQENSVIHTSLGVCRCYVGPYVTVGHRAILHSCSIEGKSLIGMGAIIMDRAEIGEYCLIGAGSLVTEGTIIPAGHLAFGSPAKPVRRLSQDERKLIDSAARRYIEVGREYSRALQPV